MSQHRRDLTILVFRCIVWISWRLRCQGDWKGQAHYWYGFYWKSVLLGRGYSLFLHLFSTLLEVAFDELAICVRVIVCQIVKHLPHVLHFESQVALQLWRDRTCFIQTGDKFREIHRFN